MFPKDQRISKKVGLAKKYDPTPSSNIPFEVALDIYNDFSRVREKYIRTAESCIPFEKGIDMKDILITDNNGNPIKFGSSYNDSGRGKKIKVITKSGLEFIGKQLSHSNDFVQILSEGNITTIHNPSVVVAENTDECTLRLIQETFEEGSEYTVSYNTDSIKWDSEIVAFISSSGIMYLTLFANISNESERYINNTEINLVLGNVLRVNPTNFRSLALTRGGIEDPYNNVDFRIIPIDNEPISNIYQKILIDQLEIPETSYKKLYFVDNLSTNVYKGFDVKSNVFIPSSKVNLFQEFGIERETEKGKNLSYEKIFIGASKIDSVQENSSFILKVSESTNVEYSFYEILTETDSNVFNYSIINRNTDDINISIRYYFNGRKLESVISIYKYKINHAYIDFTGIVPTSVIKKKKEIDIFTYDFSFILKFKK